MIISLLATATAGHEVNTCLSEETRLESSNAVAVKYLARVAQPVAGRTWASQSPTPRHPVPGMHGTCHGRNQVVGLKPTVLRGENCCHLTPVSFPKDASPFSRSNHIKSPRLSHDHTMIIPVKPIKHNHIKPYDPPVTDYYQYPMFIPCISHYQIIWVN
jgi:hypothetical protein